MIAELRIDLAGRADAAPIAALSRDAIEHGLPWRWTPVRVTGAIEHPDTNVAVVRERGGVVAFGIMRYAADAAHLQLLAVHPQRRRAGVGSALLLWLEDVARTAGLARIGLEARADNAAGRCFYSERGYHERAIVPAMYSGRLDGVQLEKWLRLRAP
jgi:ribosomal-protein-alanine N-acetyltransferase